MEPSPANDDRDRVLALLQRHGWNATSFQVLEPPYRYFFDGDACVAYVEAAGAWVAAGAPIGPEGELHRVATAFRDAAAKRGRTVCFFATEERFLPDGMTRVRIGEQPVWNPGEWESILKGSKSLREQLRRSRAKGVTVRAATAEDILAAGSEVRRRVETLVSRWLGHRRMAPMSFLVHLELFGYARERRYFVAERDGALVGLLAAVPVYARRGWLVEDLLRDPSAPNGTAEVLVDAAFRALAAEGSDYVTLGLAPLAGEVGGFLRTARQWGAMLYDFDGVRAFKARLRPKRWDPIYLTYPAHHSPVRPFHAALSAFAGGGLLRFGLQTVLRGPPIIVRVLAALLIPWTLLLALATPQRWFPSEGVKWAWVGFDVALCAALFWLSHRWRSWLATLLAVVISADAALTLFQVLAFNIRRMGGPADVAFAVAVLAPSVAACVLWGALSNRLKT